MLITKEYFSHSKVQNKKVYRNKENEQITRGKEVNDKV